MSPAASRPLDVELYTSLDGCAAGRESPAYFGCAGPELQRRIDDRLAAPHEIVMGATTYRLMAGIVAAADDPASARMTALPKTVFSRTLSGPPAWANTTFVAEPAETAVARMKAEPGDPLRVLGSLSLGASLLRAGLVDRLTLVVFPLVLGDTGEEPVLRDLPDLPLELVGSHVLDGRLVVVEYAPPTA